MDITELQRIYAAHPNMKGLARQMENSSVRTIFLGGLHASASPLFFSSYLDISHVPMVFILNDVEEAGYFYHDLIQIRGEENVLFFPSSYRRAIKYGQKDAGNEILRTEVLSRLQKGDDVCIVTCPEAIAEKVVSHKELSSRTLKIEIGQRIEVDKMMDTLAGFGFERVDYVYEPGQYALRGSIVDVFSYASEYPYRVDFFGDEIDSIRTFEVETQLSKEKKQNIAIVPELSVSGNGEFVSFFEFIPKDAVLGLKDFFWVRERIDTIYEEAVSPLALVADEEHKLELLNISKHLIDGATFQYHALNFRRIEFGNKPTGTPQATLTFETQAQPIFHKNFELVSGCFRDFIGQ